MSWGAGWGGGWGGGSGAFYVTQVLANTDRSFLVFFSEPPVCENPLNLGDASLLSNWNLQKLGPPSGTLILTDDFTQVEENTDLVILGVAPTSNPLAVQVFIAEPFQNSLDQYQVTVANLVAANAAVLQAPFGSTFMGLAASVTPVVNQALLDVLNPQTSMTQVNGGLVVGSGGDYLLESGLSLLKKLIIRRLVTSQGQFRHLSDVSYGVGLNNKNFYNAGDLIKIKAEVERQVALEPEVDTCSASVAVDVNNVLTIGIAAKIKNQNQPLTFSFPVSSPNSQLPVG